MPRNSTELLNTAARKLQNVLYFPFSAKVKDIFEKYVHKRHYLNPGFLSQGNEKTILIEIDKSEKYLF